MLFSSAWQQSAPNTKHRGMSFIDVIVGTAMMLVIFTALFGLLRASALVSALAKSKAGATAVAETQMEYLRGLSYDSVGTVGGIPPGIIAPVATTTDGGGTYVVHTFINYVDDPADGTAGSDTNGITADYKRVRVAVDYGPGYARRVALVSDMAPPSIETTANGGTLSIRVVNANGAGVPGATVAISNSAVTPAVDLSVFTGDDGTISFPGAPPAAGYHVVVTKDGYSSAQTYDAAAPNVNPNPGNLTVSKAQTTTGTFAIDALALFTLRTYTPAASSTFADSFADASSLATAVNTEVAGGFLVLTNVAGVYAASGSARSVATTSAYLAKWGVASTTSTAPAGASIKLHIYDGSGNLVPDGALAGNSAGLASPIDLSALSTTTYPSLSLGADLATNSGAATPSIQDWSLSYLAGPFPALNVSFNLAGAKTIGSTAGGTAVYKTSTTTATNASGTKSLALEWDAYGLRVPSYDIIDSCNDAQPFALSPGASASESLTLGPHTANSLLVTISDSAGRTIPGTSVTLSRSGFTQTAASSACGNAYFGGLTASSAYTIQITKAGYATVQFTGVPVSGASQYEASFN